MAAIDIALGYIARGWNPVPIPHQAKGPTDSGWQTRIITAETAPRYFNGDAANIGILLGPTSHGLTDIDLDCAEAIAIAPYVLPKTGAIFGRPSKRASHWLYYTDLALTAEKASVRYIDPKSKDATLVELRTGGGRGAQTVFPGSTHKEGEAITWDEAGEPADVAGDELRRCVRTIAAYSTLAKYWPETNGSRHERALALGGFLSRAGMKMPDIKTAAEAIAKAANDEEWRDRRTAAADAAAAHIKGDRTYGLNKIRELFGAEAADKIAEWLNYQGGNEQPVMPDNPPLTEAPPGVSDEQQAAPPLPFINMSNWDNEPVPQQEWTVPNRIPRRQTVLFSGEGAVGKSTETLHLCAAHALDGREWLGTMVEPGPAMFLDAEDDVTVIHRRLAAIVNHYQVTFNDLIKGGLHLLSFTGEDAILATASRSGKIEPTTRYRQLLEAAGDIKPAMIGAASAANIFAGSELDRSQVQQFVSLLTRVAIVANGSFLLISHPSLTGITSDSGLSGSTQWHNAVRARLYMKGIKPEAGEQPDNDLRELVFKKNQYGPVAESLILKYRDGLFLPLQGVSSLDKATHEAKAEEVFLVLLTKFFKRHEKISTKPGAHMYAPTLFAKEPEAKAAHIKTQDFTRAMGRLFNASKIHLEQYGAPSRDTFKLAPGGQP